MILDRPINLLGFCNSEPGFLWITMILAVSKSPPCIEKDGSYRAVSLTKRIIATWHAVKFVKEEPACGLYLQNGVIRADNWQ